MAGRPRSFDEEDVLTKAMMLFWQKGYASTGVQELEQATGLGRQSLYGAFGDKRALFDRVVEHYFRTVVAPSIQALDAAESPRQGLLQVFEQWEAVASAAQFNGCLMGNSAAELGMHDAELREVLKHKLRLMEDGFYRAVKRGQKLGEFADDVDARAAARSLVTTAQGLAVVARVQREPAFARAVVAGLRQMLSM